MGARGDSYGTGDAVEVTRQAAKRTVRALTTGVSHVVEAERGLISGTDASAGMFLGADRSGVIAVDTAGRALIGSDRVYGGRREAAYIEWIDGLRRSGADPDRVLADLESIWDFLRHDPKWEFDPSRQYGGAVMFGSPDIGGAAVLTHFLRDRGLGDTPVVFSGYADPGKGALVPEAVRFRTEAERKGLGAHRIIEDRLARNTGENASNSLALLRAEGRDVSSVIGGCTPQHARRVWATIMKQDAGVEHAAIVTNDVTVENYLRYGLRTDPLQAVPPGEVASAIMGEIKRLDAYPAEGHIVVQPIPDDIRGAYDRLGEMVRPTEKRF
ncbi:ElyC/SanA/YdcF family protein [Nocardia carnea]|uniref:ElyC/SanA/YdcF family protein n=1 Tax=Nocardia carnea TaxID=37328 RepID=UPI002456B7D1|nr:ElyC/SanA/YdcF family protein [Nocardia carnea]